MPRPTLLIFTVTIAATVLPLTGCQKPAPPASPSVVIPTAAEAKRTPGLWEERVSDRGRVVVTRTCLDAPTDAKLAILGHQLNDHRCQRHVDAQAADGSWRFSTVCDMGAWGKVSTDGVAKGDFTRAYSIDAQTSTAGAAQAGVNGRRRIAYTARLTGACPKDLAAGDVLLPDGRRVHAIDLAQGARPG